VTVCLSAETSCRLRVRLVNDEPRWPALDRRRMHLTAVIILRESQWYTAFGVHAVITNAQDLLGDGPFDFEVHWARAALVTGA
jgi:hypothetical protein